MNIDFAKESDIESWLSLVDKVKAAFPGLETQQAMNEHRAVVLEFIGRGEAICAKENEKTIGALLFSKENNMLCFLAVDPDFRRRHIAENMVKAAISLMKPDTDITVTTYREEAAEGAAARAFYKRIGFVEGRLTEEFGSPVQEFILKR